MFDPYLIMAFDDRFDEGAFGRFMAVLVLGSIGVTAIVIALGVNGYL